METKKEITCKKSKYVSEEFALIELKNIQKRSKRKVIPVRAYLCKHCGKWHLTSQPSAFVLQEENELLKKKVLELQETIKENNKKTIELIKQERSKANIGVYGETEIKKLNKVISEKDRLIKKLREESWELISKLNKK